MSNNRLTDSGSSSWLTRKHLTRREFGRRLHRLILEKGWSASEFARRSGILKDSVSSYVNGKCAPRQVNLQKMAKILGVDPDDLLPNYTEQAIEMEVDPPLSIRSGSDPTTSWIRINRLVNTVDLPKILEAVNAAAADND